MGLKDSKKLTPKKRQTLRRLIEELALAREVIEVTPEELSTQNVSELTIEAMKRAVRSIIEKIGNVDLVVLDAVGRGKAQLEALKDVRAKIIVSPRADELYPAVSAASILAKEAREEHVKRLKLRYGDFGSGYPSDRKTREWLKHNFDKPIVRRKWRTVQRVLTKQSKSSEDLHLT
jgi:ribonuclease HII